MYKKYLKYLIIIILVISLLFLIKLSNNFKENSYLFNIKGDYTSSGAQRDYTAKIIFYNNTLFEGTQTYSVGEGGGCTSNCDHVISCTAKNGVWVDVVTGGECSLSNQEFLTIDGLNNQINNNTIKSTSECRHLDTCYEVKHLSIFNYLVDILRRK